MAWVTVEGRIVMSLFVPAIFLKSRSQAKNKSFVKQTKNVLCILLSNFIKEPTRTTPGKDAYPPSHLFVILRAASSDFARAFFLFSNMTCWSGVILILDLVGRRAHRRGRSCWRPRRPNQSVSNVRRISLTKWNATSPRRNRKAYFTFVCARAVPLKSGHWRCYAAGREGSFLHV